MKKLLNIFVLLILTISSYAQEVEIGTIFIIQFNSPEKNMDFEIISENSFDKLIDANLNMDSIFQKKPKENQIFGIFAKGKFGTTISPMLVLVSGMEDYLDYDLKIKIPRKRRFQKTSTISLFKGVKSIEHWPYPIKKIEFVKFKILPKQNIPTFQIEEKIDSTCIKNPNLTIEYGKQEFKTHLELVISKFKKSKDFKLEEMLDYENSLNSEDVSLGHFWSLGESIYPNEKDFKFDNPISYRRIECPYFEGQTNYFYTKKNKAVKVVSFNWQTFKESNLGINPDIEKDLENEFNEKFRFVMQTVNKYLGEPVQNLNEESGRKKIKWESQKGINGYMFNFSNNREIRLYIYKE